MPDLSTFGKALANGFSVSALVGKPRHHGARRPADGQGQVFLLSTTHGAETHALAAAREVMNTYRREPVIETIWARGGRLASGFRRSVAELGLQDQLGVFGKPCCLVYGTKDQDKQPSQGFRTLFIQECMKRGVLASSLVVGYSHTEQRHRP